LQLFGSFTTGHDVSGKNPMELLQCGGAAAEDFQEARVYLDSISNRCVSYWGLVEFEQFLFGITLVSALNLSDACLNDSS